MIHDPSNEYLIDNLPGAGHLLNGGQSTGSQQPGRKLQVMHGYLLDIKKLAGHFGATTSNHQTRPSWLGS